MFFSRKISVRVCILCSKVAGKIELHWNTRGNLTTYPRVPPGDFMSTGPPTWGVRTPKHFYIGPRACPRRDSKFCLGLNFKCDLLIYAPPPPPPRTWLRQWGHFSDRYSAVRIFTSDRVTKSPKFLVRYFDFWTLPIFFLGRNATRMRKSLLQAVNALTIHSWLYTSSRPIEVYFTRCSQGHVQAVAWWMLACCLLIDPGFSVRRQACTLSLETRLLSKQRQVAVFSCWSGNLQFSSSECTSAVVIVRQRDRYQNKKHCSVSLDATSLLKMYATLPQ